MSASNGKGHGIHSPFVYEFVTKVLNDKTVYPDYHLIEKLRKKLLSDNTPVPKEDYGAGSAFSEGELSRSVAMICKSSAKPPRYAQLLYRIVRFYKPGYVLELGTSLGISTAYIAAGQNKTLVTTGEGNHVVAAIARNNFAALGLHNITVVTGNFDNTLPQMISSLPHVDMAFIDGNHRQQPTIRYFDKLLHKMPASSMLILDDIHWSRGMEKAWNHICSHPSVMLSVDLFQFGIAFFRPEFKVKQHFSISF